jgi:molybdenum cofactor guanylyltransferase
MISKDEIAGLILAGGMGRRMSNDGQGIDKGLQMLAGHPLTQHVAQRLQTQVGCILINANQHLPEYQALGYPVFGDDPLATAERFAGPLAGVHRGLNVCATLPGIRYMATAPCDSPFFPLNLVERLSVALSESMASLAVVRTGRFAQPVFTLMHLSVLAGLSSFLGSGGRKIDQWYGQFAHIEVEFDALEAFDNINTPEDLARAQLRVLPIES